jgi:hypothetical protein
MRARIWRARACKALLLERSNASKYRSTIGATARWTRAQVARLSGAHARTNVWRCSTSRLSIWRTRLPSRAVHFSSGRARTTGRRIACLLTACGTGSVRPDEMSANVHRQEAAYERHVAADRDRQVLERMHDPPVDYNPYRTSQVGLDPTSSLQREAESRRAHASEHEAAALELERCEAKECAGIEPRGRGACPVLGPLTEIRDIAGGVRLELPPDASVDGLVALMRCHFAFAQTRGFAPIATACPLYMRGIEIRRSPDARAVEIVGTTAELTAEIRKRIRQEQIANAR